MTREELLMVIRRRWKVLLLVLGAFAGGMFFMFSPSYHRELEYNGTCGLFRSCTDRYWGLQKKCWTSASDLGPGVTPTFKQFAPESACDGDWHLIDLEAYSVWVETRSRGSWLGRTIHVLMDYYEEQAAQRVRTGTFDSKLTVQSGLNPYSMGECAGQSSFVTANAFRIVLVAGANSDVVGDCWSVTSEGELRHLTITARR
jgi:hypothetical protein